jgi:cytochrome P450
MVAARKRQEFGERRVETVTATATSRNLVYDPYDPDTIFSPHALFRRLRDEAPLYYSEQHDFYAVSRFEDIERTLLDRETFVSRKGVTLDLLKGEFEIPPGTLIFDDPPIHGIHRSLLSRMFTPRRISALEPEIRQLCARMLDPLADAGRFDVVADLASQVPMRVISMLVGIPEGDQESVRDHFLAGRSEDHDANTLSGAIFAEYVDWRVEHPSDDIMTHLLNAEFEDETGATRRLSRDELLAYVNIVAAAGNETTRILIGWAAKLLAENPDQRRLLVDDPSLVTNAIEEILRYEPNTLQNCRYSVQDIEFHGRVVPAGSIVATLTPSGNRDERHFDEPDRFDVRRNIDHHLSFGFGAHYCLGQALARLEGRIVLDEFLKRFPEWDVDLDHARFMNHADSRGYGSLPVITR